MVNIKNERQKVNIEKNSGEYGIFFEGSDGVRRGINGSSHSIYGKNLSDGGNIKANDSGKNRNCLRIGEPNSILRSYKMEITNYDSGERKAGGGEVEIENRQIERLTETYKANK